MFYRYSNWRSREAIQARCLSPWTLSHRASILSKGTKPLLQTSESSCLVLSSTRSSGCRRCVWFASTRCVCGVCPCCVCGGAAHPICTDAQCSIQDCMFYSLCFHSAIEERLYSSQFYHYTIHYLESNSETALLLYLWDKCKISVDY